MLSGMKRALVGTLIVMAALAVNIPASWADEHDIKGTFTLTDGVGGTDTNCFGTGGYDDITKGLQVVVRNDRNKILATARLGAGKRNSTASTLGTRCTFKFTVKDVPESPFYAVEVGRRGELTYSAKELAKMKWRVQATLG